MHKCCKYKTITVFKNVKLRWGTEHDTIGVTSLKNYLFPRVEIPSNTTC